MWTAFWGRFLQASSSSSDLTKGPEGPHGLARKERAIQTCGRSTSLSGKEEVDLSEELDPLGDVRTQRGNIQEIAMAFLVVRNGCELDYKEIWAQKNWCFWTVVLEKTLENPSDCKEIQPVHPKGNQSWLFIGRTDAEAPIVWPPDAKNWLLGKDPEAGKDWRQEEKGTTEDEMVGWHHQLDGHEFEQAPGIGDGQGGLACCSPRGCKELDTTEWLNWPMCKMRPDFISHSAQELADHPPLPGSYEGECGGLPAVVRGWERLAFFYISLSFVGSSPPSIMSQGIAGQLCWSNMSL